jgi:hypothetical protein
MHVTGTFAWGHRPYEDAESELVASYSAISRRKCSRRPARRKPLQAALAYRKQILAWRAAHPDHARDIRCAISSPTSRRRPLRRRPRIRLSRRRPVYRMEHTGPGSWSRDHPLQVGGAIHARERLQETVAATIAFLTSAAELP